VGVVVAISFFATWAARRARRKNDVDPIVEVEEPIATKKAATKKAATKKTATKKAATKKAATKKAK
jgi:DNA topoisomerase-1